jgi:hypothetical protein
MQGLRARRLMPYDIQCKYLFIYSHHNSAMRRYPKSLWFFGAFALLFLVQLIPLVGLFLLLLMSWAWSIFFINAGFIGVAIEALTRRVHWAWLSLPLVWFGGYGVLMLSEHRVIANLEAAVVRSNKPTRLPMPSDTTLILTNSHNIDVWQLMHEHNLDVVFAASDKGQSAREYRFSPVKSCETVDENPQFEDLQIAVVSKRYDWRDRPLAKPFCVLSFPSTAPARGLYADVSSTERLKLRGIPYTITRLQVRLKGRIVHFTSASAQPLKWFPLPFIYCGDMLTGGGGKWVCGAQFLRADSIPLKTSAVKTEKIAQALSRIIALTRRKATEFDVDEVKDAEARLYSIRSSVLTSQLTVLDQAIRKATGDGNQLAVESLRRYPDRLLPRLPAIVSAIERDCDPEDGSRHSNAQQLMRLLKSLPPKALEPYVTRLDRVAEVDPRFDYRRPDSVM